jgi:UPF0042 nucleotide-binding protein
VHVVIVTGLSGSGKSTAIRVLEDLGFYCIDNLPVVLTPKFIELCQNSEEDIPRVALGIDLRERAFLGDYQSVLEEIRRAGHRVEILYLDAADDVLVRRFSETRRPHPLAEGANVAAGIARERQGLAGLKGLPTIIDTTAFTVISCATAIACSPTPRGRAAWSHAFGSTAFPTPTSCRRPVPTNFLRRVAGVGRTDLGRRYVLERTETQEFLASPRSGFSPPLYVREGRYLTVGLGCTGGRHRSVALTVTKHG